MRQYPIFNKINSCAYQQSNKSYGIKEHGELSCFVGTSKQRSYNFFNTKTKTKYKLQYNEGIIYDF